MKKNLNAIIFDLGGVLYDIDVKRSVRAFEKLGLENFDELYSLKEQTELFDKLETGKIDREYFTKHLQKHLPHISDTQKILDAWCALLIDMPQENIDILDELRKRYKLYLLSNTNEIHIEAINKYLKQNRNINDIRELFDKAYFSYEIGLRKTGVELFNYVLFDSYIDPE
jgi:putative hydrolase of the HAD superfamily